MKQETRLFLTLAFLAGVSSLAMGQVHSSVSNPEFPSTEIGVHLIVWSETQRPQPIQYSTPTPVQPTGSAERGWSRQDRQILPEQSLREVELNNDSSQKEHRSALNDK